MNPFLAGSIAVSVALVAITFVVALAALRPGRVARGPAAPRPASRPAARPAPRRPEPNAPPEILPRLPYARAAQLLAGEQRSLFAALNAAAPADMVVLPHVRLSDLLTVESQTTQPERYAERISGVVVDFVLADGQTAAPRLVVALEQPGNARQAAFVDAALTSAGLPVLRLPRDAGHTAASIEAQIATLLHMPLRRPAALPPPPPRALPAAPPLLQVVARTPARYACGRCHREIRAQARCCPHCGALLVVS